MGRQRGHAQVPKSFSMVPLCPDTAWLLGLIYGDGSLHRQRSRITIACSRADRDVPEKIARLIGGNLTVEDRGGCDVVYIFCGRLWRELNTIYGLVPNKTRTMAFPNIRAGLLPHFIRGLVDSDGSWTHATYRTGTRVLRFSFVSASGLFVAEMRNAIEGALNALGLSLRKPYRETSRNPAEAPRFRLILSETDSILLGEWIYSGSREDNRAERKYRLWAAGKSAYLERLASYPLRYLARSTKYRRGADGIIQQLSVSSSSVQ